MTKRTLGRAEATRSILAPPHVESVHPTRLRLSPAAAGEILSDDFEMSRIIGARDDVLLGHHGVGRGEREAVDHVRPGYEIGGVDIAVRPAQYRA